jgi:hypothetical protein
MILLWSWNEGGRDVRMADADPGTRPAVYESDSEKKLVLPQCVSRAVVLRFSVGNDFLLLPHAPNKYLFERHRCPMHVVVVDEP